MNADAQSDTPAAVNRLHQAALTALLPAAVLISVLSFSYARATGQSMETAILWPSMLALSLAMVMERVMPHRSEWNQHQGDRGTDGLSFAALAGGAEPLVKWLSPVAVVALYGWLGEPSGLFPSEWPFVLQVVLVTLLAELGKYWGHRWHHSHRALWWLHALHHSSQRLYALNNFRLHPLEYVVKHALSMLPLMLLGAPVDALLAYIALTQPVQMLQHVNLPLRHGWLNYFFSTNTLHQWHHSRERSEGNCNFGSALVVWDQVFGTYHNPTGSASPAQVGLYEGSAYPANKPFVAQVLSMFSPGCCKA